MFLRVTALDVPHEGPAERYRTIFVAVRPEERPEQSAPFRRRVQAVRVVEHMSGLVPHVHHDLPLALERVDRFFELPQLRIRQVERDAEYRLLIGTAPLVGQITDGPKLLQTTPLELFVELANVAFDR